MHKEKMSKAQRAKESVAKAHRVSLHKFIRATAHKHRGKKGK